MEVQNDAIVNPEHYTYGGIEVKEVWKACLMPGLDPMIALYLGNILKYLHRHDHKNGNPDLLKAANYESMIVDYLREQKEGKR